MVGIEPEIWQIPVIDVFELIDAGDAEGLRELLARQPEAAAARDAQGLSALMRAAYRGGAVLDEVRAADPPLDGWDRILVGDAAGLPAPDDWTPDGFTALHIAAFAHNADATRALLAAGADPNVLARASFATVTPLGTAATFGATDVAAILLDAGADTESTGNHGGTPLHSAAANGNRSLIELLLANDANPDARNDAGKTPADLAESDEIRALLEL
jgi:uncharacterized protein